MEYLKKIQVEASLKDLADLEIICSDGAKLWTHTFLVATFSTVLKQAILQGPQTKLCQVYWLNNRRAIMRLDKVTGDTAAVFVRLCCLHNDIGLNKQNVGDVRQFAVDYKVLLLENLCQHFISQVFFISDEPFHTHVRKRRFADSLNSSFPSSSSSPSCSSAEESSDDGEQLSSTSSSINAGPYVINSPPFIRPVYVPVAPCPPIHHDYNNVPSTPLLKKRRITKVNDILNTTTTTTTTPLSSSPSSIILPSPNKINENNFSSQISSFTIAQIKQNSKEIEVEVEKEKEKKNKNSKHVTTTKFKNRQRKKREPSSSVIKFTPTSTTNVEITNNNNNMKPNSKLPKIEMLASLCAQTEFNTENKVQLPRPVKPNNCHHCKTKKEYWVECPHAMAHRFCNACVEKHFHLDYAKVFYTIKSAWAGGCPICKGECPCASCRRKRNVILESK